MMYSIKKKKSAARFAMSSGGAAAWILINAVAASLYEHNRKLMSNSSSAGNTQLPAAASHLVAHTSSRLWCKALKLPPTRAWCTRPVATKLQEIASLRRTRVNQSKAQNTPTPFLNLCSFSPLIPGDITGKMTYTKFDVQFKAWEATGLPEWGLARLPPNRPYSGMPAVSGFLCE